MQTERIFRLSIGNLNPVSFTYARMDQFLADVMGVRATIATNADTAAAEGAAKALAKLR